MSADAKNAAVFLGICLIGAILGACTPEYRPETFGEGDSLNHNFMSQAIDPMPNQTLEAPDQDGRRAADAYERYREGKVIKPINTSTSGTGN